MKGFLPGNQLRLLCSGAEYFPALLTEIDGASKEIRLETYIFESDATGRSVAVALGKASRRGVDVNVMVDGFGAAQFNDQLAESLRADGVKIQIYRPELGNLSIRRHRLRRLHRKLSVFDQRVAFVGGINIIDDSNTPHQTPPRFDYAVRIEGPLVERVHDAMLHLWQLVTWAKMGLDRRRENPPVKQQLRPLAHQPGPVTAALVIRDNLRHRHDIENAYLSALSGARHDVLIANAYFLPGRTFRRALINCSKRGVKVSLLLQGQVEYALMHYATLALYARLLGTGIRVFEYRHSFLHAKVAVIDDHWATVGSSNIDPFSLLLAREANIVVRDKHFAQELKSSLLQAITDGAIEIRLDHVHKRGWIARTISELAYATVRLLIGMSGYARRKRKRKPRPIAHGRRIR